MLRKSLPLLLALCLLLSACGPAPAQEESAQNDFTIVATTYPVYLFAYAVTQGAPGIQVSLMIDEPVSCLHDYTLTVKDMELLEGADAILLSGAGLEESMADALSAVANTPQIDCSQNITLREYAGLDHDHEGDTLPAGHEHEADPHIWLDPNRACQMIANLAAGLTQADPANAALYETNARLAQDQVKQAYDLLKPQLAGLTCRELVTFHDGFSYFAEAFDLTILRAIEEESGSEASAKEVAEIVSDIQTHQIPAIFTEVNGADAAAQIIHREGGVPIYTLDLMMSVQASADPGIEVYLDLLQANVETILEAYQ